MQSHRITRPTHILPIQLRTYIDSNEAQVAISSAGKRSSGYTAKAAGPQMGAMICVCTHIGEPQNEDEQGEALCGHDDNRESEPQTGEQTRKCPLPDGSAPQTARQKHLLDRLTRPQPQTGARARASWVRHPSFSAVMPPVPCPWSDSPRNCCVLPPGLSSRTKYP